MYLLSKFKIITECSETGDCENEVKKNITMEVEIKERETPEGTIFPSHLSFNEQSHEKLER